MSILKFKIGQLRLTGNSASYRKLSAVAAPYVGFQAFLTTLERGGHRFKPTNHVLNTGLPLSIVRNTFQPGWYSKGGHVRTQL